MDKKQTSSRSIKQAFSIHIDVPLEKVDETVKLGYIKFKRGEISLVELSELCDTLVAHHNINELIHKTRTGLFISSFCDLDYYVSQNPKHNIEPYKKTLRELFPEV
jgi:hypothetical protein